MVNKFQVNKIKTSVAVRISNGTNIYMTRYNDIICSMALSYLNRSLNILKCKKKKEKINIDSITSLEQHVLFTCIKEIHIIILDI